MSSRKAWYKKCPHIKAVTNRHWPSAEADLDLEMHEYSPSDLANAISNLVNDPHYSRI